MEMSFYREVSPGHHILFIQCILSYNTDGYKAFYTECEGASQWATGPSSLQALKTIVQHLVNRGYKDVDCSVFTEDSYAREGQRVIYTHRNHIRTIKEGVQLPIYGKEYTVKGWDYDVKYGWRLKLKEIDNSSIPGSIYTFGFSPYQFNKCRHLPVI